MNKETIDALRAAMSIQQNLIIALFAATENKDFIIDHFSTTSEITSSHALYSDMTDAFYEEFERQRDLFLPVLHRIREELGPPK